MREALLRFGDTAKFRGIGKHAGIQDLRWTVGATRELDLHSDFAGDIADPQGIGSVPPSVSVGF